MYTVEYVRLPKLYISHQEK